MTSLLQMVRRSVLARKPVDRREADSVAAFISWTDTLAEPFDEEADPVHITGSAFVVGPRGIVLHKHKRLGLWLQPGGHIDAGETPWDAALREVVEETGLVAWHPESGPELVHVDVHAGPRSHTHLDLRYLIFAGDVDPAPPPGESQDVRWFTRDEALGMVDESMKGALIALFLREDLNHLN